MIFLAYLFRKGSGGRHFFYNAFHALAFNGIDGDYTEFGSHGCNTFSLAYHESRRNSRHDAHLWAFDSFQGLPKGKGEEDSHPYWVEGTMATSLTNFLAMCTASNIPDTEYTVVPGFYEDTLPSLGAEDVLHNIALAYIDCDLYSSTSSATGAGLYCGQSALVE